MNNKEINIDKNKVITNSIIGVIIVVVSTVIILSIIVILTPILKENNSAVNESKYVNKIEEALVRIYSNYVDDISMDTLVEGAIKGMSKATGDPYTRFVTQEEYNNMLTEGTEKYNGLGIHITYEEKTGGIIILSTMPNSPALSEGLLAGDIILKVGDVNCNIDTYYDCVNNIKGEENSKISLTILRGNKTFTKEYTRKKVTANNIEAKKLKNDIGYIRILAFENNVANQFKIEYDKFKKDNIKSLIIDLRNNPGGLVNETIDIARMLLPKGDIIKLVYKKGSDKVYTCDGKNKIEIPLVVLVNENSASASEILSGAIKDSKLGILIGEKTFGKGIVQTVEKLEDGNALSLTTAKYYTISGVEIHKNGIEPDFKISLDEEYKNKFYVPLDKDFQLQKAIEILNKK
ncbi:MAG: S41 family peptidase [Clostridia bacterium]